MAGLQQQWKQRRRLASGQAAAEQATKKASAAESRTRSTKRAITVKGGAAQSKCHRGAKPLRYPQAEKWKKHKPAPVCPLLLDRAPLEATQLSLRPLTAVETKRTRRKRSRERDAGYREGKQQQSKGYREGEAAQASASLPATFGSSSAGGNPARLETIDQLFAGISETLRNVCAGTWGSVFSRLRCST